MNFIVMHEFFEIIDLYKILAAIIAGGILGIERELKDKAAGLKTITVITLGATLYTILSTKITEPGNDTTRIASYIVSGIGFLGAGVIYKDRNSVNGLTTASVIWVAAAIGMALGFGEFIIASVTLILSFLTIHAAKYINRLFISKRTAKTLKLTISKSDYSAKQQIIDNIKTYVLRLDEVNLTLNKQEINIFIEVMVMDAKKEELESYLIYNPHIISFEL